MSRESALVNWSYIGHVYIQFMLLSTAVCIYTRCTVLVSVPTQVSGPQQFTNHRSQAGKGLDSYIGSTTPYAVAMSYQWLDQG